MKNTRYLPFIILALLSGCSDNSSDTQCTTAPYCTDSVRYYCDNGELRQESCAHGCQDGVCQEPECRTESFEASCVGQTARACVNDKIVETPCQLPQVCTKGACVSSTNTCDPLKFAPQCDNGQRVSCIEGTIEKADCEPGKTCQSGECIAQPTSCGNGTQDAGELCDEGKDNGLYGHCRVDCSGESRCGDGTLDAPDETCDDGDNNGKYGYCDESCARLLNCGNGTTEGDEGCDDGENNGKYGYCRADCSAVSKCGDGVTDAPDELCDDGKDNGTTGACSTDCKQKTGCGNGVIEAPGESCDPPSTDYLKSCTDSCKTLETLFAEFPAPGNVTLDIADTCDPSDIFQKYLRYRERFIGNAAKHIPGFINWGTEPGQSLPASYRDPEMNCASDYAFNHSGNSCKFADLKDAQGGYRWGDTSLELGIMIHWLATEYRMFKILGIDTTETAKYLSLAIKAFDRLDEDAEKRFNMTPKLDGFFTRDDIPHDFFKSGNGYRFERTDGFAGYECAGSDYACASYNNLSAEQMINDGYFISQDQVTGLFEGFGMAAFLLPEDAEYDGMKLRHEARARVDRLIRLFRDNHWLIGIQTPNGWQQVPGTWGGYVQMFSGLFAEAANTISAPDFGLDDYHDAASQTVLATTPTVLEGLWPAWETINNYNRNLAIRLINFTDVWDDAQLLRKGIESGRELWPLAHALVTGRPLSDNYPFWHMHTLLAQAPCNGSCSGTSCANPTLGWMGESYFVSPNDRFGSQYNTGEYNGLDYLIAHNLYFLAYAQKTGRSYSQIPATEVKSGHRLGSYISGELKELSDYQAKSNPEDMVRTFCERPFADWIRDNALGLVDIYTLDNKWQCDLTGQCTIAKDKAPYTSRNALIIGTDKADAITIPSGSTSHHCIVTFDGDDVIQVSAGMHHIDSGKGNDTITTNGYQVSILAGDGDDIIKLGDGFHMVDAGPGNDTVTGGSGTNLIAGSDGNDIIKAGAGNNRILGGPGNDTLEAGSGDNAVWGHEGDDKIKLGNGNNRVWTGEGRAFVILGNGNSTVVTASPQNYDVKLCFGTGNNTIWAGWSSKSHCIANRPNTNYGDNSCVQDLTDADCTDEQYNAWK
ncbi:MAG: calcium-binding protein [Proteobacteria bacterium]|nr:calcium-binding protein [Pseudomonadota bacterium]